MKYILFNLILLYASIVDIKKLTVPTHVHILLLLTGLLNVSLLSVVGYIFAFLPIFIPAVTKGGLGGGDVKFVGMCGFVLQGTNGLLGLIVSIMITIIIQPLIRLLKKDKTNVPIPLIPYFSAGFFLVTLTLF